MTVSPEGGGPGRSCSFTLHKVSRSNRSEPLGRSAGRLSRNRSSHAGRVRLRPVEVALRATRTGDGESLARLWLEMSRYYAALDDDAFQVPRPEGLRESFERDVDTHEERTLSLVAEVSGGIVGWVYAHVLEPQDDAAHQMLRDLGRWRLSVDALVVLPAFWRLGIGSQLMEAAEAWARDKGAVVCFLNTYVHSPVSVPFYETRMGYRRRSLGFWKRL
jgi:GNAT superfamily N-acetyltransferase